MKNNNVVFILPSLSVGGAEKRAASVANYLVGNGLNFEIVLLDNPNPKFDLDSRIKVTYLTNDSEKKPISLKNKLFLRFYRVTNKERHKAYDQLLFFKQNYSDRIYDYLKDKKDCTVVSWTTEISISMNYALRHTNIKKVFVECTSPYDEYPQEHFMNQLKKDYYKYSQKCICQTDKSADFYNYLSKTKKYVIPNPIIGNYPDRFIGTRKKAIVNFCRLSKVKNIPLLIDAFELLNTEYPEYELHIYGEGIEKNSLINYVSKKNLTNKVLFFDFDVHLHNRIKDYSMFVSSSDREGMSNSMLEAMAIGLPTIVTDTSSGAARMLINDYENGIVVPVKDKNALYKAMKYVVDNPQEAEKMSTNAIKIKDELSIERIGQLWKEALVD